MKQLKITIRLKLLLLSIAVLSIPYFGLEYLRELERYLQDSLELSLIDAANAVAGPLHEQSRLFPDVEPGMRALYVHDFQYPVHMDGYEDDWSSYLGWADIFSETGERPPGQGDSLSYRIIVSSYGQYFNLLLKVTDENIVYQKTGAPGSLNNDYITLVYTNYLGELERYYFSATAAGTIRPFQYRKHMDEFNIEYETIEYVHNINGELRETADGYNMEIIIPRGLVTGRMGIVVSDVDDAVNRKPVYHVGTAGGSTPYRPGRLAQPSRAVKDKIEQLANADGRRIWILDKQGQVLSSTGNLEREKKVGPAGFLYSIILPSVNERFNDDLEGASRLEGEEVKLALQGVNGTNWRSSPDGRAVIISAASPVWINGEVGGVVVVEETTNSIQMVQRQAMKSLFDKSVFVFASVTLLLLIFATRLSFRLQRLSREAENAIDEHGRVVSEFSVSRASDEIGDLSRNYASMLGRLKQYNQYLEGMSGKLSHELRTPITVVQSSLDHLQSGNGSAGNDKYLERAREGIERLNLIVTRLSEATRLEQAIQSAEKTQYDMADLLKNCTEGYRIAYPGNEFLLSVPDKPVIKEIVPDLIVQMVDKLVDNAIGFSEAGKPIEIGFDYIDGLWQLKLTNYGPQLPEMMADQMFNSMVSIRDKKNRDELHLGLGLYIVRLIAEYHGAVITTHSDGKKGTVSFIIRFKD